MRAVRVKRESGDECRLDMSRLRQFPVVCVDFVGGRKDSLVPLQVSPLLSFFLLRSKAERGPLGFAGDIVDLCIWAVLLSCVWLVPSCAMLGISSPPPLHRALFLSNIFQDGSFVGRGGIRMSD